MKATEQLHHMGQSLWPDNICGDCSPVLLVVVMNKVSAK
jgi:hypothetical protein